MDNGTWLYKDYKMTYFPKSAERNIVNNILSGHLKYYLYDELKKHGAQLDEEFPMGVAHTVIHREFIPARILMHKKALVLFPKSTQPISPCIVII